MISLLRQKHTRGKTGFPTLIPLLLKILETSIMHHSGDGKIRIIKQYRTFQLFLDISRILREFKYIDAI